jgi:UDP-2-acetamido-2-deoxy-ribo-hexuluronate aminotransferase
MNKQISMVDLKGQYEKIKPEIDQAIHDVIDSTAFINGDAVKEFKQELEKYLRVKHVIPCANGTDALQIAMMALDLKPGDEVITTGFTFIATVEVISLLGLKLVIADVDPDTFLIDPKSVEKAITSRTRAIVPVHLFGQCADMDTLLALARKHKLFIIEDAAQSLGADYKSKEGISYKSGTMGEIGCTSFFPSKNLGCFGDGGAMFTNDDKHAEAMKSIANHGMRVRYYHDRVGVNSRLDSIQAAILKVKLRYLDDYTRSRQQAAAYYDQAFENHPHLQVPVHTANSSHIFHQYTLRLINADRNALKEHLGSKGIPAMIYYPVPLHLQKAYMQLGYAKGDFPVTEQLCDSVISMPMHTELDSEQLSYITTAVLDFFK